MNENLAIITTDNINIHDINFNAVYRGRPKKILVFKKVWSVGWCLIGSFYSIFTLFAPSSILPLGTVCFFILVGLHPLITSFMKFKF